MNSINFIILATILVMVFLIIQGSIKLYIAKKEYLEENKKVVYENKFVKVNYENDIQVLIKTIEEYSDNISFTELKEYHGTKNIINDKTFSELVKKVTIDVYSSLSKEYLDLVGIYVSDPQLFIYEKVYYRILKTVIDINYKNIVSE